MCCDWNRFNNMESEASASILAKHASVGLCGWRETKHIFLRICLELFVTVDVRPIEIHLAQLYQGSMRREPHSNNSMRIRSKIIKSWAQLAAYHNGSNCGWSGVSWVRRLMIQYSISIHSGSASTRNECSYRKSSKFSIWLSSFLTNANE